MRQFKTLYGFEMKKIAMRKSTWVLLALILFYFISEQSIYYIEQAGRNSDSSYNEEEEFSETLLETMRRDIKNAKALSGRALDDSLLKERNDFINGLKPDEMSEREKTYALDRYRMLTNMVANYTMTTIDYASNNIGHYDLALINKLRQENLEATYSSYKLSDKEIKYWQDREDKVQKPIILQYEAFYETLTFQDIYLCMFVATFWIAVVISQIFAEEHNRKTDQLILSSRFGKKHSYFAKISAGITFTLLAAALIMLIKTLFDISFYGTEGFNASILLGTGQYSSDMTFGQSTLIMLGIFFLAAILTAILAMFVSERFKSSIAAIAVIVALMFVASIVNIPIRFRLPSQLWYYFPINLVRYDKGFYDLRLVSIGNVNLTSWQIAPFLYVVLGIILVIIGKRIYCKYQVS